MERKQRVWFITGCSTGFGRHLAEAALKQGDQVVATARKIEQIKDLEAKYPSAAKTFQLDVTDKASIAPAVQGALAAFGRIDVLVNNAGYGLIGAVEEVSDEQIRAQFETNVFGLLNVTRGVIPVMRQQGSGHILNISSLAGRIGMAMLGLYNGSKFALEGISEALAGELKPFGIKVTIVEPGGFATDFSGRSIAVAANPLPPYQPLRDERKKYSANFVQGDAATGVQTILKIVDLPEAPMRVVLGPNSMPRLMAKLADDLMEYKKVEELWKTSTGNAKKNSEL